MKWASCIPLAGGMSIGCEQAFGKKPDMVFSFPGFQANDSHYLKWLGESVPYNIIGETDFKLPKKGAIQVVNSVCPCAGLSMLNTGGTKENGLKRGSDAAQNAHMYNSSRWILENVQPQVLWGENAPALYSKIGAGVAENLEKIAEEFDYSFSILKTNTDLHGVPQNRPRTFFFFWKSESAPILNWHSTPMVGFADYLKQIPATASWQDDNADLAYKLQNKNWTYMFAKHLFGDNYREEILKYGKTLYSYVWKDDAVMKQMADWAETIKDGAVRTTAVRVSNHMIYKKSIGKGVWDGSIHVFSPDTKMNAVIGRNMSDTIHPTEERYLNIREFLHLMGHPHDYELTDKKFQHHLTQNVPVATAKVWAGEVELFLKGKLELSGVRSLRQDNVRQTIDTPGVGSVDVGAADFIQRCM